MLRHGVRAIVFALSVLLVASQARAQGTFPGAQAMGEAMADMTRRGWLGPRVEEPMPSLRPADRPLVRSFDGEITIHGDDAAAPRAAALLAEIEAFAGYLRAAGFHAPVTDGGRGGEGGLDVYLVPTPGMRGAFVDSMAEWSFLDRATVFAQVDPLSDIRVCGVEAYARAALLSLLPEEGATWHNAFASWLTWRWTGHFGCASAVSELQDFPERGWFAADDGAGGGVMLALLSERHGAGTGAFLRELLEVARQRTWEGEGLRGSPDLYQALSVIIDAAGESMNIVAENLAWDRYFIGHGHDPAFLAGMSAATDIAVEPLVHSALDALPYHSPGGVVVNPYGTAYARVDVRGAPPESRLRIWLRGEYGVEWALSATRIDASGDEHGRLSAPPRRADGRSYLPLELTAETQTVLVAVTNLSHRLPDEDERHVEDPNARSFRLIFDIVDESAPPEAPAEL